MKHFLFSGNESPEEIRRILLDNAEGSERKTFTKKLSQQELTELREQYAENNVEIGRHNDILNEAKKVHKEATAPLKEDAVEMLKAIKTKHREIVGEVFKLANHESGFMEYVDTNGDIVETRRLTEQEKQSSIFSINRGRAVNE